MDKLADITAQGWIMAYFIRSDGERFLLGTGAYDFKSDLQHFQPNTMANDIVELQGTDGQLLAGQVRRSATQSFDGYVGDSTQNRERIEELRRDFLMFFRKNFFYKTVYIYPNGTAIQRKRGYIVDAPSVPELYQFFPEYHVALNYEDPNYYEYAEDAQGDEIFANILAIALSSARSGGLVWDALGAVSYGSATASGSSFQITGIEGAPLTLTELKGNATQNGTPTPDAPVAVQTVSGEQTITISDGTNTQEYTIYLGSIELAKIGTYQDRIYKSGDDWFVRKEIGKAVIDGSVGAISMPSANRFNIDDAIRDYNKTSNAVLAISDRYEVLKQTADNASFNSVASSKNYAMNFGSGVAYNIRFKNTDFTTIVGFKAELADNPPTVYYALTTPTTTEITNTTLLAQLNFIANLYGGTNNIMLVGTGAQGEIRVVYMAEAGMNGAGYVWEDGGDGGETTITLDAVEAVRPVWAVTGPATDPTLTNITTGETIAFTGTVPAGQTLTVDMDARTATMAGANVFQYITGDWLRLEPGNNRMSYTATGATEPSTLSWNGVVG